MFSLGPLRIGDDLLVSIRDETVQLRPDEGLRVVERLLRVSTRKMMTEEAEAAVAKPATKIRRSA